MPDGEQMNPTAIQFMHRKRLMIAESTVRHRRYRFSQLTYSTSSRQAPPLIIRYWLLAIREVVKIDGFQ
jgi:hypothetical protein